MCVLLAVLPAVFLLPAGVCQLCEAAKRLGVPLPVSIQVGREGPQPQAEINGTPVRHKTGCTRPHHMSASLLTVMSMCATHTAPACNTHGRLTCCTTGDLPGSLPHVALASMCDHLQHATMCYCCSNRMLCAQQPCLSKVAPMQRPIVMAMLPSCTCCALPPICLLCCRTTSPPSCVCLRESWQRPVPPHTTTLDCCHTVCCWGAH